jgi:acetylornithine deacetylase
MKFSSLKQDPVSYVRSRRGRLSELIADLVQRPSENKPPNGFEGECQKYAANHLKNCGAEVLVYEPDQAPSIADHALFWPGRNYKERPNVAGKIAGAGGGRSLILSGHIDTVPVGSEPWRFDPFGAEIDGDRLYGRGANDMKAGIATNLFIAEALADMGVKLKGELTVETVVDEEFGGVNGTLAGRVMGIIADAAVISEPSFLRICPAQRGGRTVHLTFSAPNDGVLGRGNGQEVVEQLRVFLAALEKFRQQRREQSPGHRLYSHLGDPVPVNVTRIFTAPWGMSEPTNTPSTCRVELFWQAMPGESLADIDHAFLTWLGTLPTPPAFHHPIRWLPGSAIAADHVLVSEFSAAAEPVLGTAPVVQGIEGPCDMYVFHEFGVPAVLWGARGGNTHNPDEYVELSSVERAAAALLSFVCRWCGVAS